MLYEKADENSRKRIKSGNTGDNRFDAFLDGANFVIDTIVGCWDWHMQDNRLIVPSDLVLHRIEEKINEMKGELTHGRERA